MISCEEAVRQLWRYVELAPTPEEAASLEAHLVLCRRCCGEAGFADELRGVLSGQPDAALPADAALRFEELIARLEDSS